MSAPCHFVASITSATLELVDPHVRMHAEDLSLFTPGPRRGWCAMVEENDCEASSGGESTPSASRATVPGEHAIVGGKLWDQIAITAQKRFQMRVKRAAAYVATSRTPHLVPVLAQNFPHCGVWLEQGRPLAH